MRLLFCLFLLAVKGAQPSDGAKLWSDWLSEGKSLTSMGNYSAAAHAFREALAIAERSTLDYGKLIEIHDVLAGAYAEAGQYAESEREYRRALTLVEKSEGRGSLNYAVELASLAALPTQTGDLEPVIQMLRHAISLYAKSGPVNSLASVRSCLVLILRNQKRYQEEEPLLLDALDGLAREKATDPHLLAGFLNDLAVLRLDQRRYSESLDLQQRSILILEGALGKEHPSLVVPLNNLATTYRNVGRFAEAGLTYRRAIDVCGKTLGEDHLDYAVLLENYAVALKKLGQKRQATKVEAQALQIHRAANRRNGIGSTISLDGFRSAAVRARPPN